MRPFLLIILGLGAGACTGFAQQSPSPEALSITLQGNGHCTTRSITVGNGWHVEWTSDAGIKIRVIGSDNHYDSVITDSSTETSSVPIIRHGSSMPMPNGGAYTLEITTTGSWQISAMESGFAKNKFSDSPASSSPAFGNPINPMGYRAQPTTVNFFSGTGNFSTPPFTVKDGWQVMWTINGPTKMTLLPATDENLGTTSAALIIVNTSSTATNVPNDANALNTDMSGDSLDGNRSQNTPHTTQMQNGLSTQATGGTFSLQVTGTSFWSIRILQMNNDAGINAASTTSGVPGVAPSTPTPATPPAPAVVGKLTDEQTRAVVLIVGDNAEGTGFMVKTPDGPAVVTNIHVIANNPNLKITTNTGALVTMLSAKGASDRDLAMISIKDANYSYFDVSTDISKEVQPGDEVITPGNSEGGEVMLNTVGKVLGIGPERIEFDNPIYHGNSGGPVIHTKSNKVLGVVTEAIKVDLADNLDKASFASRNSAISGSMRYFGLRLDTVSAWVPIDWKRFQIEASFLDQFDHQSRALDSYLNPPDPHQRGSSDSNKDANLYRTDEKIMQANNRFEDMASGADTAQRIEALKGLLSDLQSVADINVDQISSVNNFYSFDRDEAKDQLEYRKALKEELDRLANNIERLGSLPRSNN